MAQNNISGAYGYVNYGYEASYGAGAVSSRVFGHGQKISLSRRNNMDRIHSLGQRNAYTTAALKYEGTVSVDFVMANASFFRAVLGTVADLGAGPYTHTYTESNTPPSFAIDTGSELGTNDEVTELKGCMVNSMTMTATTGDTIKVRLECPYQNETLATSGIGSQVVETFDVFTFAHGTLELPTGSTIGDVQSFELTANNNLESVFGLGSRQLVGMVAKIRQYDIRMTVTFKDVSQLLQKFYGGAAGPTPVNTPAATATLKLTFTNGLLTTNERSIVMTFANIYLNEETLPKDVNEVIKEDVSGWAHSCTSVVWTNNTAVDIGNP
jgi:hypothetical protein